MAGQVDAQGESGRAVLGRTLRFLREEEGESLGQLAEETGYDKSYLSRLESGERLSKVTVVEDLDGYYGCGDLALSPSDSLEFIRRVLKEHRNHEALP